VAWPLGCPERDRILEELTKKARALVDERVKLGAWPALHLRDIAAWLQWRGCEFTFSVIGGDVSKDQLVRHAKDYLARAAPRPAPAATFSSEFSCAGDSAEAPGVRRRAAGMGFADDRPQGPPAKRRQAPTASSEAPQPSPGTGATGAAPATAAGAEGPAAATSEQPPAASEPPSGHGSGSTPHGVSMVERLRHYRDMLEAHRLRNNGTDQSILPVLYKIEALDASGAIDQRTLMLTKLGVELNGVWWRRACRGPCAQLSGRMVSKWKDRCNAVKGGEAGPTAPSAAAAASSPETKRGGQPGSGGGKRGSSTPSLYKRASKRYEGWKDGYRKLRAYGLTTLRSSPRASPRSKGRMPKQ